jgi:hypothetical protein
VRLDKRLKQYKVQCKKTLLASFSITTIVSINYGLMNHVLADVYAVDLSGYVLQRPFQRTGYLQIVPTISSYGTQNGVNPYDIFLQVGDPYYNPTAASIYFMSNNAFISPSYLDLAYVSWIPQSSLLRIWPDKRIAATASNIFTGISSIVAQPYRIDGGYMDISFLSGGNINGYMDLLGFGMQPGNGYRAWFRGYWLSRSLQRKKSNTKNVPFSTYPDKRIRLRIQPGTKPNPLPPPPDIDSKGRVRMKSR